MIKKKVNSRVMGCEYSFLTFNSYQQSLQSFYNKRDLSGVPFWFANNLTR